MITMGQQLIEPASLVTNAHRLQLRVRRHADDQPVLAGVAVDYFFFCNTLLLLLLTDQAAPPGRLGPASVAHT